MKYTINKKRAIKTMREKQAIAKKKRTQHQKKQKPILAKEVVRSLTFFNECAIEKEAYLDLIFGNAFIHDITGGIKVFANDQQIAGGITWTENGRKNLMELKECLRLTMHYAKYLELLDDSREIFATSSNYMLYSWGNFIANCPQYEELIEKLFATSLVYVPLKKGRFSPYETSAFGQMWENIIFLIDDIQAVYGAQV